MGKFKDLTGQKFGRLTVIRRVKNLGRTPMWVCICDCGAQKINAGCNLRSGKVRSCGCLRDELAKERLKTHGMGGTHFYSIWTDMKTRIINKGSKGYRDYGGRGIKILWKGFESFKEDMYNDYIFHVNRAGQSNTTIERIDVDGDYSKENCRWATKQEQGKNKRNSRFITFGGKRKTAMDWSRDLGIPRSTIQNRLNRKLPIKIVLQKEIIPDPKSRFVTYKGKTLNLSQWGKTLKRNPTIIHSRLKRGWGAERAITTP